MKIFTEDVITQVNEFIQSEVLEIDSYDVSEALRFKWAEATLENGQTEVTLTDHLEQLDEALVCEYAASLLGECLVNSEPTMNLEIVFRLNKESNELQLEAQLVNTAGTGRPIDDMLVTGGELVSLETYAGIEYQYDESIELDDIIEELHQSYPDDEDIDFHFTHKSCVIKL